MNFEILPPEPADQPRTAYLKADLKLLREFLRLPATVTITAVRPDPDNPNSCILDLHGYGLPADGELLAHYTYQHHTIPRFDKFEPAK